MGFKVAVVGATGNVGREMLNILAERRFPTDEAQAMEWRGHRPLLVACSPVNIKITRAEDLLLASAVLKARHP